MTSLVSKTEYGRDLMYMHCEKKSDSWKNTSGQQASKSSAVYTMGHLLSRLKSETHLDPKSYVSAFV